MDDLLLRRRMMLQSEKDGVLTFTAEAANSSVQLTAVGSPSAVTLEYNLNNGGWLPYTIGDVISLPNVGNKVKMRGNNATFSTSAGNYYKFFVTGYVAASGDVTSLQNEIGGDIVLTPYCYFSMFRGCAALTAAPVLPSTTLAQSCYAYMFQGCAALTAAPVLPSTTLATNCYAYMFQYCAALTAAPVLPSTTLATNCYGSTFGGCTSVTSHDVATLNTSPDVFANNSSCASLTIHADTPPTIASSTITGLKADCVIYVPAASVDAYKAAQYWSARSAYIQAIP